MLTQLPRVPSLIPSSFATLAIGREVSITIFTASSLNSGEKLFFGRGNYFTFPDVHPIGWTVRKLRGTPVAELAAALAWYARRDAEFARELAGWAAQAGVGGVTQRVEAGRDAYTAGRDQTVVQYRP